MNEKFLLQVVIPTLNGARFIEKTLQEACRQALDYEDVSVLVVDNNSQDNTAEITQSLQITYKNLEYSANSSTIPVDRNIVRALEASTSKYCWILADDDVMLEGSITKIRQTLLEKDPSVVFLNYILIDEHGDQIYSHAAADPTLGILDKITRPSQSSLEPEIYLDASQAFAKIGLEIIGILSCIIVKRSDYLDISKKTRAQ